MKVVELYSSGEDPTACESVTLRRSNGSRGLGLGPGGNIRQYSCLTIGPEFWPSSKV